MPVAVPLLAPPPQVAAVPRPKRVEAHEVRLVFGGVKVLDGISLELYPGELVLLRGDNGSGKTTLLHVLSGYLKPDAGYVSWTLRGRAIPPHRASPERLARSGVGRLWQDVRLFPTMSVLDNVVAATPGLFPDRPALALRLSRILVPDVVRYDRRLARERALHNLARVGMADRARSSCDKLSVGQMKRVAVARLLQMDAEVFFLDEPLAGLDAPAAEALAENLQRLRAEDGRTLLVVEHRHERVADRADRTLFLRSGRIEPHDA